MVFRFHLHICVPAPLNVIPTNDTHKKYFRKGNLKKKQTKKTQKMPHKKMKYLKDVVHDAEELDPWEIPFPLPKQTDPSMCRDTFLKGLIREHESRVASLVVRSTMRGVSIVNKPVELHDTDVKEAEAMVVLELAKTRQRSSIMRTVDQVLASIRMRSSLIADLIRQIQKAAIEFLSVRLLKQLRLFSIPWPGELDETPNNLFNWSLDDFLLRLNVNQIYLDVLNRERSVEDLDCVKFCKDLSEMELLIHEIRDDFRSDVDLYENSIPLLKKAEYNTNAFWVKSLNDNLGDMASNESNALLFEQTSTSKMLFRNSSVMGMFETQDPIETRYQINWIRSCTDQRLFRISGREAETKKELHDLKVQALHDESVQYSSELMYSLEVEKLKQSIEKWQERLDTDLENANVMCTVSRLALQKVKDDLKFYMEQKEMYLRRIDEVQAIIDQEKMTREERELAALKRKSRGSLRMSVRNSEKNFQTKSERKSESNSGRKSDIKAEKKSETMMARKSQRISRNSKVQ
ncbi:uncharacterized protein LOC122614770 isoform X2 [Drosophila teissieri]|uniref:uncharacterized protein LOC122614770 isoform X2 n=1 Tax=Drosophila teissieri TaxID=7243 RepID=UPI001CBA046C|nr:uncharacterized protein LOC122614770 isoform X2 [Drosophila teissieri]